MAPAAAELDSLRGQIAACEARLQGLRRRLADAEGAAPRQSPPPRDPVLAASPTSPPRSPAAAHGPRAAQSLPQSEYRRYGRQLILPEIGLPGQLLLRGARVLVVGLGGLGCPAAAYLAGAGVGTLGLVDGDVVEESNLHRQTLHATPRVGMPKVDSAVVALHALNPLVTLIPHASRLAPENALSTFRDYDVVLDCTDTPASRYLISDACVLLGKPLVSASALRVDGQMMVLNHPPLPQGDRNGGPCYRCVFPKPPPPESVVSCGDGGILGPVVGVMGVLQALECIKLLTRTTNASPLTPDTLPSLLIFSAYSHPAFRSIRLRSRKLNCAACSASATVTPQSLDSGSLDYVQFCGALHPVNVLSVEERVSAVEYATIRSDMQPDTDPTQPCDSHILLDVREKVQFDIGHIQGSVNIPFSTISRTAQSAVTSDTEPWVQGLRNEKDKSIYVVCRLGNDSQLVVQKLKGLGLDSHGQRFIGDMRGGLHAWRRDVDPDFPDY